MFVMMHWIRRQFVRNTRGLILFIIPLLFFIGVPNAIPSDAGVGEAPKLVFGVVTEKPLKRDEIVAQVLSDGKVQDAVLRPSKAAMSNPMWKTIEMCQGIKAEAIASPTGYQIMEFRILGASMLPMPLQAVAGDCFLKKALEYAPLVE